MLHGGAVEIGLNKAATYLLVKSDETIPIDTREMVESGHKRQEGKRDQTVVVVAYDGDYTVAVHEIPPDSGGPRNTGVSHGQDFNVKHAAEIAAGVTHMRRPQEAYKFLENAVRHNVRDIAQIVHDEVENPDLFSILMLP